VVAAGLGLVAVELVEVIVVGVVGAECVMSGLIDAIGVILL
jgi:hypothetical protein